MELIRGVRWPRGAECPQCGHHRAWQTRERGLRKYFCARCRHKFTDTSGTVFARTRTPLCKWMLAIGLWKLGVPVTMMEEVLGVTYKTAWDMSRKMSRAAKGDAFFQKLADCVKLDRASLEKVRSGGRGRAPKRVPVCLVGRGEKVCIRVPGLKAAELRRLLQEEGGGLI